MQISIEIISVPSKSQLKLVWAVDLEKGRHYDDFIVQTFIFILYTHVKYYYIFYIT